MVPRTQQQLVDILDMSHSLLMTLIPGLQVTVFLDPNLETIQRRWSVLWQENGDLPLRKGMYSSLPQTNLIVQWNARIYQKLAVSSTGHTVCGEGTTSRFPKPLRLQDEEWLLQAEACSPLCCRYHHLCPITVVTYCYIISSIIMTNSTFPSSPTATTTTITIITCHQSRPWRPEKEWVKANLSSRML